MQIIVFLGMLLNTKTQTVSIPVDKRDKALKILISLLDATKATVLKLQQLTGLLNFIGHSIVPGRAFTKRICRKFANKLVGKQQEQYHHVTLDREFYLVCYTWILFLRDDSPLVRPFVDFKRDTFSVDEID